MAEKRVLVVDDELSIVEMVLMLLDDEAIGSTGATDRAGARLIMERQFFPVVVADIRLHTIEEGMLLLDDIRALAPEASVVCMTGSLTADVEAEVRRRGARYVVEKSTADVLVAAVRDLLAEIETLAAEQEPLDLEQLYASTRALMHSIPMRRYGLSLREAEDVVHDAWMLFLERRGIIRSARAWLAGTVSKLCMRRRERSGREVFDEELLHQLADERSEAWSDVLWVQTALARVDSRSRLLCTLIGMEGHSYGEVSAKTGYAPGAIGPLYIRAKKRLKKALGH